MSIQSISRFFSVAAIIASAASSPSALAAFEALPAKAPSPAENPQTTAKVELGKKLFFDTRLSRNGTISCNSCHNVLGNGADLTATGIGIDGKRGGRNSPTVWNAAFQSVQFWDGRAPSLEEQAKGPMTNPIEMGMDSHDTVVKRLKAIDGYVKEFNRVFPGEEPLSIDNVVKAIAAYERTLITPNSPYDRYVKGNKTALTAQQVRGMKLVQEVGCTSCHMGANFSGPALPEGTGFYQKFPMFTGSEYDTKYALLKDNGRFEATKKDADKHFYRVPTWRNVAITAPYFHNGSVKTLEEAVKVMAKTQLNKTLADDQVTDIVSFLNALTGEFPKQTFPLLPQLPNQSMID